MGEGKRLAYVVMSKLETFIITRVISDFSNMSGKACDTDDLVAVLRTLNTILDVKRAKYVGCDQLPVCPVYAA